MPVRSHSCFVLAFVMAGRQHPHENEQRKVSLLSYIYIYIYSPLGNFRPLAPTVLTSILAYGRGCVLLSGADVRKRLFHGMLVCCKGFSFIGLILGRGCLRIC